MDIEVRLRVPNMKVRALGPDGYPIDHSSMRFRKIIEVESLPTPGRTLQLITRSGRVVQATVVRTDLDEARKLFVVSCQYAARSISPEDYAALRDDPECQLKHLLE